MIVRNAVIGLGALVLTSGAATAQTVPTCPAGVQVGSVKLDIMKMERNNGILNITYRAQSDFNVPMKISPYQWGHDRHQVRDSLGQDWPYMHNWGGSKPNTALEPGQFYRWTLGFQLQQGETTAKSYDVVLNFMTIPARAGLKLGESRMVQGKWRQVPAACETPSE